MSLWTQVSSLSPKQWLLTTIGVGVIYRIWYKATIGKCSSKRRLDGHTVLITGANSGIGLATALDMARRGARVLLACRNPQRGQRALEEVRAVATGDATVELLSLDLDSFESVRACAQKVLETESRLDILINNAGIAPGGLSSEISPDGLHKGMQSNHFGPFLFTVLLVPLLKKSAPSRVVFVASLAHVNGRLTPERLEYTVSKELNGVQIYSNTKLLNIITSNELSRRLSGTGVISNSLHPGLVLTDIVRVFPFWFRGMARLGLLLLFKNMHEGAQTTIHLAVCEEVEGVTGRYFYECKEIMPSKAARDEELACAIWEKSEELVGLSYSERIPAVHEKMNSFSSDGTKLGKEIRHRDLQSLFHGIHG